MVGCRYNAKNTLVKNYLYLAEKRGVTIRSEAQVTEIRFQDDSSDGSRFTVVARPATRRGPPFGVAADHVVVAAGTLGTLELLLRCRDAIGSLPGLSPRLGAQVRTNSESLLGSGARRTTVDYSEGIAISADVRVDSVTHVQPVRYSSGSSFMRLLASPLIEAERQSWGRRLVRLVGTILRHPLDFLDSLAGPAWAERTTILLVMQRLENHMTLRWQRRRFPFVGRGLRAERDATRPVPGEIRLAHKVVRDFAHRTDGVAMGTIGETLFNMAATAHLIGGCPMGLSADDGVVDWLVIPQLRGCTSSTASAGEPRDQPEPDDRRAGRVRRLPDPCQGDRRHLPGLTRRRSRPAADFPYEPP
jgi:cholesterol oxidase